MSTAITQLPHAHLIELLGHVVHYRPNGQDSDIWGALVSVEGDWATIAGPADRLGNRRKDEVPARFVFADPT
jgi:hypothetical protein